MTDHQPYPFDALRETARRVSVQLEALRRAWHDRYAEQFAQVHADLVAGLRPKIEALAPIILGAQDLAPRFEVISRQAADAARALLPVLERLRETWEESQPRNWRGLEIDSIMEAIDLMAEAGYCLVWTPRTSIVQAVLDVEPAQRAAVLFGHRQEIVDDLQDLLTEVTDAELAFPRLAVQQAIGAHRTELFIPAQAAAAVVFTHFIAAYLGRRTKTALKLFQETDPKDATIFEFRLRAIYAAAAKALAPYNPVADAPNRSEFNRHSSLHRVMPEQYTEFNSLVALMLVVPMLRELDYWFKKQAAAEN